MILTKIAAISGICVTLSPWPLRNGRMRSTLLFKNSCPVRIRKSRDRAYKVYLAALRRHRYGESPISPDSRVDRISFQRLLWGATSDPSDAALDCARQAFRDHRREFANIARGEIDGLLGALLLLDDRLKRHDETPKQKDTTLLDLIERNNKRSSILSIITSIVELASIAAKDDIILMTKFVVLLDQIPEGHDTLRGIALGCVAHFANTVAGLKLILPHLYYGLVGPSTLVRSYAADALGESSNENIPPLVYEAFSVLLWDSYKVVHKSAVKALRRFDLPAELRGRAAQALLNWVAYYSSEAGEGDFLVQCIELVARADSAAGTRKERDRRVSRQSASHRRAALA